MTSIEKELYLNEGFTEEQIEEIGRGQDAGIDTSVYENTDFLTLQMQQIRLGMQEHLSVEIYAKVEFDWLQMEEIRKGLKAGVDVSIYASPEIPYEKMQQVRKGLKEGINLMPYIRLKPNIMREIRKAVAVGVNITKYINEGYDADQISEIRNALQKGVDIDSYLSKRYRAASIAQICKGLERGIDVNQYVFPYYSWRQMREIRLGLENRIDIEKYNDRLYGWNQMREIRLGLQQGLYVDGYSLLRYTASEMRKKRLALLNEETSDDTKSQEQRVDSEDFIFEFSSDNMKVYMQILIRNQKISEKYLMKVLNENGICKGIKYDAVRNITNGIYDNKPILIAEGKVPTKGKDGWYEFLFRTEIEKKPKVLEDGTVDYQNIEWFEMVKEGQKVAIYHPAQDGISGYNVKGESIQPRKGSEQRVLVGKGFRLEDDKQTYVSALSGIISYENNGIYITNHLVLDEVTAATGNITFNGSVHVIGDVGHGTSIKADGDVVIDGTVEGAIIESGGSVMLKKGMNSAGHGFIQAEKDVVSKFFESVKVTAKGDIDVNKCLNSQLYSGGMITSSKMIVGGIAQAEKGFDVRHVGNKAGLHTVLKLKVNNELWEEYVHTKSAMKDIKHELDLLNGYYSEFNEKFPPQIRNNMEVFQKVEKALYSKKKMYDNMNQMKLELENKIQKIKVSKITINGYAYEGVIVEVDDKRWSANNERNIVIKKHDDDVEITSNF